MKKIKIQLISFFLLLFFSANSLVLAQRIQETGEKRKENKVSAYSGIKNFDVAFLQGSSDEVDLTAMMSGGGKNFLLLIAVDKYKFWKSLSNPVKDARDVKKVLTERYGFEQENIYELFNEDVTAENLQSAFESLKNKGTNIDNLIIYYSGHGYYDPSFDLGYWVPSEGKTNNGAVSSFIPNDNIRNYIKALEFRHVFMIADACFSGSLFLDDTRSGQEAEAKDAVKSRWGLSSGNIEEVSDGEKGKNSPFAKAFVSYLQNNLKDRMRVSEVVDQIKKQVAANTQQTPMGNRLSGVGDEGGEFVFILQGMKEQPEKPKK